MKNPESLKTVYFVKPVGLDGPVKIGCSEVPANRLQTLAVWSPWPLEVAASAPGTYRDEQFLHTCFAESHSHREWFHATPKLREIIAKITAGATLADIREQLTPVGSIRGIARHRKPIPEYRKELRSYASRIRWAETKLRRLGNDTAWAQPIDVHEIIQRWDGYRYRDVQGIAPTAEEKARLDEYLSDPAAHSILPWWARAKAAA